MHVQRDAVVDLDVVLGLLGLGERDADGAHVADVERDEEARDHVVRRGDGRGLEELLVVLEVLRELVKDRLRDVDAVGGRVGEAEGGGLERREDARRGRGRERRVQVADDGELLVSETGVGADVSVICERGFERQLVRAR